MRVTQTELMTKIRGLASREQHSSAEYEMTMDKLRDIEKHTKAASDKREQVTALPNPKRLLAGCALAGGLY